MIETLKKYGFLYAGTCACDGPKTQKFKKGDYRVYWNKVKKTFRIKNHGRPITTLLSENELDKKLKEIFPQEAPVLSA